MRFILFLSIPLLFLSCAPTMRTISEMDPLGDGPEAVVDQEKQSISQTMEGITITVSSYGWGRLRKVTRDLSINPFIYQGGLLKREAVQIATVFHVLVENKREDKIEIHPSKAVILDGLGNQLGALTEETFRRLYPTTYRYVYDYDPFSPYPVFGYRVTYTEDFYKRLAAARVLLKDETIFPGVRRAGLLAFEPVSREAKEITLIIPDLVLYKDNEPLKRIDFKFRFKQRIRVLE